MKQKGDLISSSEAARILGITKVSLHRLRKAGVIDPAKTTPGGHHRFRKEDVIALAQEREANPDRGNFEEIGFLPLNVISWVSKGIVDTFPTAYDKLDQFADQKNSVSVYCDLLNERIEISFAKVEKKRVPSRGVEGNGDTSFVMNIAFEFAPTKPQFRDAGISFVEEGLTSILFVLRGDHGEIVHSSSHLRVFGLKRKGWYWISILEHLYVLRLPHEANNKEWEIYATKCLVAYQALEGEKFHAPPFHFMKDPSESEE